MLKEIHDLPDVSFIDDKQLEDVQSEMIRDYQDKYKEITGKDVKLDRADPVSLMLYSMSIQIFQAMLYVDRTGKMDLLKYSFGPYLDNVAAMKGIIREPEKPARTMLEFTLSAPRNVITGIPAGTRATDGELYFETTEYAEIPAGMTSVKVDSICLKSGIEGNGLPIGAVKVLVDPIPYIAKVSNTDVSTGGVDIEDDESMKERIFIAPSTYSVAGPDDAYRYWSKTFNADISDVLVYSDTPVEVSVVFIMKDGELPTESMISGLQQYLMDGNIRPLTDKVTVKAPGTVDYNLSVKYFINQSDLKKVSTIKKEVEKAVDEFILWQRSKIGRDINSSKLVSMMMAAGAKRVEVTAPVFQTVGKANVAKLVKKTVVYGGLEDD